MSREPEPPDVGDDAWVVRASVARGRMPYAPTRRVDVAHPYRGVAAHGVDLADIVQRAHAVGLLLRDDAAISHVTAARVRGLPLPRALRLSPDVHVSVPRPRRAPRIAGSTVTASSWRSLRSSTSWSSRRAPARPCRCGSSMSRSRS